MNVGGIPWGNHGSGFWWVIGVLLLSVVVTLLVLRWRRFL
jgi:Mg2+ and Co2+ transporter CorA